ncbi:MAG: SBBP repeat-containing protein [Flavobacteriales bacterium]|nr:SBBP repeat-containing protein [Flavobacteriales bacterium]
MRSLILPLVTLFTTGLLAIVPRDPISTPLAVPSSAAVAPTGFEENKGQVRTTEGELAPYVRYRLSQGNTQLFLLGNGIAYQFKRSHLPEGHADALKNGVAEPLEGARMETGRMDVMLEGALLFPRITTEGRSPDHTNYYADNVEDVHSYTKLTHHDVYPGIDWVVFTTPDGIKQDFIVHPGADPSLIRMRHTHHEELFIASDGGLVRGNSMGRFTEKAPLSFQDGKQVATRFVLDGNVVRFELGGYDRARALTIDPDLIWGTYYGGGGFEEGMACATAANGNVALAGWTDSSTGIASGGHQNTSGGGNADAFLAVFNSDGVRLWATYYGGGANEVGHGCAFDAVGNVYLSGYTESSSGIASAGHQGTYGGGQDAFLVKFNNTGARQWATYYGGSDFESKARCTTDGDGNVFICGWTNSLSGISSAGHQNSPGGLGDAYLVKFDPNGNRSWATYYGGAGGDEGTSCAADQSGNVYLSGSTNSSSGIASGGFMNAFAGGDNDLFLVKFTGSGSRQWGTYYGGADTENDPAIATDVDGNVYMSGTTRSTSGISSGGHQNSYGGTEGGENSTFGDGLLAKFSGSGSRLWATYYGGSADESGDGCAVDGYGNAYLAGQTNSPTGIATPDGHQPTNAGGDAYIVKFNPSGIRQWGTYYGGNFQESVRGCSAGPEEMVNVAGTSGSTTGIAYNGHQNSTTNQAAFLAKFGLYIPPSVTIGTVDGSPFCAGELVSVPYTVEGTFDPSNIFIAELSNAGGSFSSPVSIGILNATANGTIIATIPTGTSPGNGYRIRVIASDPDTVGIDNGTNLTINNSSTSCICADQFESEPNNSTGQANALSPGTDKSGTMGACIAPDNSSDYFSLTTTSQGVLRVQACLSNTGPTVLDVTFRVLSSSGSTLSTHVLQAGANKQAVAGEFEFLCLGIGSYRIAIDNPTTAHCTFYSLSYSLLAPVFGSDPEPNDAIGASATPVVHNTDRDGRNGFDLETTYDYYSIVLPTNGVLNIEVHSEHAGAAPDTMVVALLNSSGTVQQAWDVAVGANGTPITSNVSITCRSTVNTYYIRINSEVCGTSYRFKYTVTPPHFAADTEPNNSAPGTALAHDTYTEGQLQFDAENVNDIYNIVAPSYGVMTFEVQAEHTGATPGSLDLALLTAGGSLIQSWTIDVGANGTPDTTVVSIPCRSTLNAYNLRLTSSTCGISYRLKYTMTAPHFAADTEPNDGTPGTSLAHNTYTEGRLAFDGENAYDYYTIAAPTNGVMTFEVQAEHTGAAPSTLELRLYSSTGIALQTWNLDVGANGIPDTSTVSIRCQSTVNPYNVRLTSSTCGVSYRIQYSMTAPYFAPDAEPNNLQPGTPLPYDTYTEGHLEFYGESFYDLYRIVPSADGMVNIEVEAEHAGPDPGTMQVALLSSAGIVLHNWNVPVGTSSIPIITTDSVTCRTGSTNYDLRLSSSTCGISYKLKWTLTTPVFTNDTEPNNSTAQAIVLPETQTTQGRLNFGADNTDQYRVNLSSDGELHVLVEAEHAGSQPNQIVTVQLFLSSGTVLETWTAPIGSGSIPISSLLKRACLGNTVQYYLRISSDICLTSYRLSYTVAPPPFANDPEPNNNTPGGGGPLVVHDTYQDGHLEFYGNTTNDLFNIVPPINGVMRFELQAEHVGAMAGSMELRLYSSAGTTIQFWTIPVGANGVPVTSVFSIPCRSSSKDYDIRLSSTTCGTSYRWKYTMLPAVFPTDAEPNNQSPGGGGPLVAHDTFQEGQLDFDDSSDADQYNIVAPTNGVMTFEVQAEHVGAVADSMELRIYTSAGTTIQFWTIPVGANGVPVTSTFSIPCRTSTTDYDVRLASYGCGVSYRWKYTMAAPVFANDVESNGSTSSAIVLPGSTPMTGQLNFGGGENNDYYRINIPADGVLHVTIEAEHAGASTIETLAARISLSTSTTLATWNAAVGANSTPASTSFSLSCRGTTVTYYLNLSSNTCGASYRVSWTITEPVYANDPEPNNSGAGTPMNLNAAGHQGHIGFYNTTDDDYYGFTHPGGPWSVTISAEHVNAGQGSMVLEVRNSASTLFGSFTVPVGGSSTSLTNTFTLPSLSAGSLYRMILKDVTCGVSYRIHCYDADGDGTCNTADVCAGGPEPGMPCDDNNGATINDVIIAGCSCEGTIATVSVPVRVMLEGPYDASTGLMNDALRGLAAFPLSDPYPALGYTHTGGSTGSISPAVLSVSGDDAITDWVLIELRDANDAGTVVSSRSALLQRDGDVVDLDGTSPVAFAVGQANYYVAALHRNHLGCMTGTSVSISSTSPLVDLTTSTTATFGTDARKSVTGAVPVEVLWSGDVNFDGVLKYTGTDNDRDPILIAIGGTVPTNTTDGYRAEDVNLDGTVKYTGTDNDRDPILINIGGVVPTNSRSAQLP